MMTLPVALGADWVDLWPGEAPGAKRPKAGTETTGGGWRFSNIEVPQYTLFKAEKPNGTGVVVLPGGGYAMLAADHEGKQVGEFFAKRGVTAIVVKYRVSGNAALGYQFPVPQMDARRAIRTMRFKAKEWGIDAGRIGIMGFSAGGHLCSTAVTMFDDKFEQETKDEIDQLSCRPDFGILCYPVISMGEKYCHSGSVRNLLGGSPSKELLARNNTAKRVTKKTPPIFMVHSADDGAVPLRNGTDFAAACAENKVPVVCHFYAQGGHGYGLGGKGDSAGWTKRLEDWMISRKLLPNPGVQSMFELIEMPAGQLNAQILEARAAAFSGIDQDRVQSMRGGEEALIKFKEWRKGMLAPSPLNDRSGIQRHAAITGKSAYVVLTGRRRDFSPLVEYYAFNEGVLKYDWHASEGFGEVRIPKLKDLPASESRLLRVVAKPANLFSPAFPEADFSCGCMHRMDPVEFIWGYARGGSEVGQKLQRAWSNPDTYGTEGRVTIRIQKSRGEASHNRVEIVEFLHGDWFTPSS
jgi:acetyl esterase/lipase